MNFHNFLYALLFWLSITGLPIIFTASFKVTIGAASNRISKRLMIINAIGTTGNPSSSGKITELDTDAKYWPSTGSSKSSSGQQSQPIANNFNASEFTQRVVEEANATFVSLVENAKKSPLGKRAALLTYAEIAVLAFIVLGQIPAGVFPIFGGIVRTVAVSSLISGIVIIVLSVQYIRPENLNIYASPTNATFVCTSGPYELVRHPLYGGLVALSLGLAMITNSMERTVLTALLFWILDQKINYEEKELIRVHGQKYQDFIESTPQKLIPLIH